MLDILAGLNLRWEEQGRGLDLGEQGRLTHLVWDDNIYFFGCCEEDAKAMWAEFTVELEARDLRWKDGSKNFSMSNRGLMSSHGSLL